MKQFWGRPFQALSVTDLGPPSPCRHDMWHLPAPRLAEAFRYPDDATGPGVGEVPTFWAFYGQIIVPVIIWGCGTALGELPPYLVSYSAAKAGEVCPQCVCPRRMPGREIMRQAWWWE